MTSDANQELFDAALRHQVALRRYGDRTLKKIREFLEEQDRDLVEQIRPRLARILSLKKGQGARLEELLRESKRMRDAVNAVLSKRLRSELFDLSKAEAAHEKAILTKSVPIEMNVASASVGRLKAVVTSRPFEGRLLREWFQGLNASDKANLSQALRLGIANGEALDNIVKRIVGTRANRYSDGVLSLSRRNAESLVRTAITHVSNAARSEVWDANANIIWGLRWTSTLDGRTSKICQARDGDVALIGGSQKSVPSGTDLLSPQGARPPAHIKCRSLMVALLSPEGILGDRPFVRDARTPRQRDVDFAKEAKASAGESWGRMSAAERNRRVAAVRKKWGDENIGQVPASTTYEDWIRRQPEEFQDATLGPTRARLFRSGKLSLSEFVDVGGRTRTLDELNKLMKN